MLIIKIILINNRIKSNNLSTYINLPNINEKLITLINYVNIPNITATMLFLDKKALEYYNKNA